MLLKKSNTNHTFFKNTLILLKKKRVLVGIVLFTFYTVLILGLGYALKRNDIYGLFLKPVLLKNYHMVGSYLKSFSASPEKIVINIKHKDYLKGS